ncbi:plasma-membrane calcium-translocating P-type ATPase [Alkalibacterium subtropicum]|uniref:P-type Ca(2+) transporter n=1 Tax=Alkalibacterium subtropicum TaxID=753702 RepID=A0A1I1K127_9LACT|nr:cation-translocating P-type ATPase [Alkalibacterium subtropicum]SFC54315.1 plasma-membrane calcium-translocating P-type ATPase [Alkalibacterium subtropicum]
MNYYQETKDKVLESTGTSREGLSQSEAEKRLEENGYNEISRKEKKSIFSMFIESFKDPMVIVLLIVAIVQVAIGEWIESLIIFVVLILNAILSVVQTKKAEDSLESLEKMSAPTANVYRDGNPKQIEARNLAIGDIVILEAGDNIPADGRLIEAESLQVEEGALTGESMPSEKTIEPLEEDTPLADRINMVYSSTMVTAGRGVMVVTSTGEETEMGKVAELVQSASAKQTPLQRRLADFSKKLGVAILLLSILIFGIQAARIFLGDTQDVTVPLLNAFMFAAAVAVAAIPEALQSIVTIVLSVGTNKMAKQHAIIRQLPAVETLGSTSVICTDKTGTLTQNKMTVVDEYIPNGESHLFSGDSNTWSESEKILMQIAVLANDSTINEKDESSGDPTEVALIAYSNKQNLPYGSVRDEYPRLAELPFDSSRKRMSTVHEVDGEKRLLTKGGPDVLFELCSRIKLNGEVVDLTEERLEELKQKNEEFSDQAMRVLAFAYKPIDSAEVSIEDEDDLIFIGLLAMIDPPREAVYHAVQDAANAGVRTVMITGDHKTTARAIGRDLNIFKEGDLAYTGQELDDLSEEELMDQLEDITVYARVTPENKIRIVTAWENKNQITAMTGDGVNDAPALKQADIGIAMGSGTDVAKDASAMILTDDNFVSIVKAISVGRTIYSNIKKSIAYLFSGNLGAVIAIIFALIVNWVSPFTALQLLFINLVNDSLPAIALGLEPAEPNVMEEKPRDPDESIFSGNTFRIVAFRGALIAIAVVISQYIGLQTSDEMSVAMAFTTLILSRTLQVFPARSNVETSIGAGFFSNKFVILAFAVCLGLYGITLLPAVRSIFYIPAAFGLTEWAIAAGLAFSTTIIMELRKIVLPYKLD